MESGTVRINLTIFEEPELGAIMNDESVNTVSTTDDDSKFLEKEVRVPFRFSTLYADVIIFSNFKHINTWKC